MKYQGLFIEDHTVKNEKTKFAATKSLRNWQPAELTAENWMQKLDKGQTIQPSTFRPTPEGKFTHTIENWQETYFVCADADNISGVEFDKKGTDLNPDGIPHWKGELELSAQYPNLPKKVYAVGQSVSSMSTDKLPLHRRYRLIFLFDKPIQTVTHYHHVLISLAKEFPIIPKIQRSPAQPVFGNARAGTESIPTVFINNIILKLDDYPLPIHAAPTQPVRTAPPLPINLEDFLKRHTINYTPTNTANKFFVQCPFEDMHASGKNNPKDAYVFDDGQAWGFNCSHTTCKQNGRATWHAFKAAHNIRNNVRIDTSEMPIPIRIDIEAIEDIPFPSDKLKGTIFGEYETAYAGRNETSPAFRFAELAFVLGALAGRKISLKSGARPIYPNMYFALVGRTNFARKSESLHKIRSLIREFESDTLELTNKISSSEGLIKTLSEVDDMRLLCLIDEFKAFFTKSQQKVTEGLIPFMNEAADCPPKLDSKTKENRLTAIRPNVNMIGCLTPQWFEDSVTLSNLGGGFINRIAFFLHEQQPLISLSEITPPEPIKFELTKQLIKDIAELNTFRQFVFSEEVRESEKIWYHKTMSELLEKDDIVVDATARVQQHVIKFALLLAYMNNPSDDKIHLKEWECAREIGAYLTKVNLRLFSDLSFDKLSAQEKRVLKHLDELGGDATKSDLSNKIGRNKKSGVSSRDLQRILEALTSNEIIMMHVPESGRGVRIIRIN